MSATWVPRRSALGDLADELRESVQAFVTARSPEAEIRRLAATETGFDPDVWAQMADQLELPGMTIPERFGGSGFAIDAQAVVFEEMGRALMCTPYLATVLAAEALVASGDAEVCETHLPAIASGATRATLALVEAAGGSDPKGLMLRADPVGDRDARLTGVKKVVLDGASADLYVVVAREAAGLSLFVLPSGQPGVTVTPAATLDPTRKLAHLTFEGATAQRVGAGGAADPVLQRVLQLAAIALSAELVGCASACLEMSVQYAKDRYQFGRPIGAFQAIKHKCADMLRLTEQARAAAYEAAVRMAAADADGRLFASVAKVYCGEAASWVAGENIQVHGGIGYTWEHPAHLYLRRAKANEQLFGGPFEHRRIVAECVGL